VEKEALTASGRPEKAICKATIRLPQSLRPLRSEPVIIAGLDNDLAVLIYGSQANGIAEMVPLE